ncbi:MAG: STAS domain-containing protein [Ignavibacteriaceae bacterium]|nr:STAS domain-containing protein [Ignavibacteriaceae bacterium]
MGYIQEEHGSTLVEVVDIARATLYEAHELTEILSKDIEAGWRNIVIDLSECDFIDSTYLGAIVISLKKINDLGGQLRLVGLQPEVIEMFRLTKMNKIFKIFENREDALDSFK